ncbi:hypothetical protein BH11PSE5_BH11PSE5_17040 [soil metagenome]
MIMNAAAGKPVQKMTFGRMSQRYATFTLGSREHVTAERMDVGKPALARFVAPVDIWVTGKKPAL